MVKKVLITGSSGVIGTVLMNNLDHELTPYSLPKHSVLNYEALLLESKGHNVIIHLAWDTKTDNYKSGTLNTANIAMARNIYDAAVQNNIPRVIMASSVHADNPELYKDAGLMSPYALPNPDSPYGAGKCMIEALGRYYSSLRGLEVICLRFGGINAADDPDSPLNSWPASWLSHLDCCNLVEHCISASIIPNHYSIIYAVSDNIGRVHDLSNGLAWKAL